MKTKTSQKRGFTLVEIMIVVGIIMLLATIAVPNFVRARKTAATSACIVNLKQIEGAINTWATETKAADDAPVDFSSIRPYLKGQVVCPAGGKTFSDSYQLGTVADKPTCLKQPETHKLPEDTAN